MVLDLLLAAALITACVGWAAERRKGNAARHALDNLGGDFDDQGDRYQREITRLRQEVRDLTDVRDAALAERNEARRALEAARTDHAERQRAATDGAAVKGRGRIEARARVARALNELREAAEFLED